MRGRPDLTSPKALQAGESNATHAVLTPTTAASPRSGGHAQHPASKYRSWYSDGEDAPCERPNPFPPAPRPIAIDADDDDLEVEDESLEPDPFSGFGERSASLSHVSTPFPDTDTPNGAHAAYLGRQLHSFDEILLELTFLVRLQVGAERVEDVLVGVTKKSTPGAGSHTVSSGRSRVTSHSVWITGRGVKYWPAPRDDSCAERESSSS